MSYIGNTLPANFQSLPAVQRFNGDGSDTTFTLAAQIANDQSILVSVDGVTQDSNAYSVSGTTLTFTSAPSAGTGNIFVNTISPVGSTITHPASDPLSASTGTFSGALSATTGTFTGDVGIGTTSPDAKAHIYSGTGGKTLVLENPNNDYSGIEFRANDLVEGRIKVANDGMHFFSDTGTSSRTMLLNPSGNVGIGTGSPSGKLTIEGTQNSLDSQLKVTASGQVSQYMGGSSAVGLALGHDHGSLPIVFKTGVNSGTGVTGSGTERVRILGTGGLTFNGDTAAANALSDYEEGTWTAAVATGVTLSQSAGTYTKIGRQVTVSGAFNVGSVSSPSGGSITGLPFTSGSGTGFSTAGSIWLNAINDQEGKTLQIRMDQNTTNIVFTDLANGNSGGASSYLKANSVINLSLTYFTA
mgnify:CR=1 FL=1